MGRFVRGWVLLTSDTSRSQRRHLVLSVGGQMLELSGLAGAGKDWGQVGRGPGPSWGLCSAVPDESS